MSRIVQSQITSISKVAIRRKATMAAAADDSMPVQVMKFGGSSVGSGDAMKGVANILMDKHSDSRAVGVLSAMYGVTNCLTRATNAAAKGAVRDVRHLRDTITHLHRNAVDDMMNAPARKDECMDYVEDCMNKYFDSTCEEIAQAQECSTLHSDRVWSIGERFTNKIVSAYIKDQGTESDMFESDKVVVTNDKSGGADPLLEETRTNAQARVRPALERGACTLVTGYFGATKDGKITTLGRGGSDLTAAVLGYGLDAERVELYKVECSTDSNGWLDSWQPGWEGIVHCANPTDTISALAYEEAAELAHFGKKVLHPQTVFPAVKAGIPIAVKNTLDAGHPGTVVCSTDDVLQHAMSATNGSNAQALSLDDTVDAANREVRPSTVTKVSLEKYSTMHGASLQLPAWIRDIEDGAIIATVGVGVAESAALRQAVVQLLTSNGINVHVPETLNGSDNNFSVMVRREDVDRSIKTLYYNLITRPQEKDAAAAAATMAAAASSSAQGPPGVSASA